MTRLLSTLILAILATGAHGSAICGEFDPAYEHRVLDDSAKDAERAPLAVAAPSLLAAPSATATDADAATDGRAVDPGAAPAPAPSALPLPQSAPMTQGSPAQTKPTPSSEGLSAENKAIGAALADGLTTNWALAAGSGVESNSLVRGFPLGLLGITVAKVAAVKFINTLPEAEKRQGTKAAGAVWSGASMNNLMILVGAPPPFPLIAGLAMAVIAWRNIANQYEAADRRAMGLSAAIPGPESHSLAELAAPSAP